MVIRFEAIFFSFKQSRILHFVQDTAEYPVHPGFLQRPLST